MPHGFVSKFKGHGDRQIHHLLKFEKNKSKEKYHLFSQSNTSLKFISKKFYLYTVYIFLSNFLTQPSYEI